MDTYIADLGYVKGLLKGISDERTRRILDQVFTHLMENIRLGVPDHQTRAENLQAYWMVSTTATDTGQFSIQHGLLTTPKYAIPALELDRPGAQLVPLEVSRAADNYRIYLKTKSGSTNVPILLLTEG